MVLVQNFLRELGVAEKTKGFGDRVMATWHEGIAAADAPKA